MTIKIKRLCALFEATPLHPQWLIARYAARNLQKIAIHSNGRVLDIGCGTQAIRKLLTNCEYVGIDYYFTATMWYGSRPDLFATAQDLPLADQSVHTVLLLDVIEHLREPNRCVKECHRVLSAKGKCLMLVPFMYPIHDAPLDYRRWTRWGLTELFHDADFSIQSISEYGGAIETAGLLCNLAIAKSILDWTNRKSPALLLSLVLLPLIPVINIVCFFGSLLPGSGNFMPCGYMVFAEKN